MSYNTSMSSNLSIHCLVENIAARSIDFDDAKAQRYQSSEYANLKNALDHVYQKLRTLQKNLDAVETPWDTLCAEASAEVAAWSAAFGTLHRKKYVPTLQWLNGAMRAVRRTHEYLEKFEPEDNDLSVKDMKAIRARLTKLGAYRQALESEQFPKWHLKQAKKNGLKFPMALLEVARDYQNCWNDEISLFSLLDQLQYLQLAAAICEGDEKKIRHYASGDTAWRDYIPCMVWDYVVDPFGKNINDF